MRRLGAGSPAPPAPGHLSGAIGVAAEQPWNGARFRENTNKQANKQTRKKPKTPTKQQLELLRRSKGAPVASWEM